MKTFLVTFSSCFTLIHADCIDEAHNILLDYDQNFSFKDDKIVYYFGETAVEVSIEDKTDERGVIYGGSFG